MNLIRLDFSIVIIFFQRDSYVHKKINYRDTLFLYI